MALILLFPGLLIEEWPSDLILPKGIEEKVCWEEVWKRFSFLDKEKELLMEKSHLPSYLWMLWCVDVKFETLVVILKSWLYFHGNLKKTNWYFWGCLTAS